MFLLKLHIISSTAHFLKEKIIYEDEWIITKLLSFLNELKNFLGREEVQIDPNYQRLRCYFSALLESIYTGVKKSPVLANLFTYKMEFDYLGFLLKYGAVTVRAGKSQQAR